MIETQYEPGTVAKVTNAGKEMLAFRVGWPSPDWVSADVGTLHAITDVRPLVVLDLEDEATIDRVANAIRDHHGRSRTGVWAGLDWLCTREAVRSLVPRAKPEEPTGKYSEVEDHEGYAWFRDPVGTWRRTDSPGNYYCHDYASVPAVKVLSEGVTDD